MQTNARQSRPLTRSRTVDAALETVTSTPARCSHLVMSAMLTNSSGKKLTRSGSNALFSFIEAHGKSSGSASPSKDGPYSGSISSLGRRPSLTRVLTMSFRQSPRPGRSSIRPAQEPSVRHTPFSRLGPAQNSGRGPTSQTQRSSIS